MKNLIQESPKDERLVKETAFTCIANNYNMIITMRFRVSIKESITEMKRTFATTTSWVNSSYIVTKSQTENKKCYRNVQTTFCSEQFTENIHFWWLSQLPPIVVTNYTISVANAALQAVHNHLQSGALSSFRGPIQRVTRPGFDADAPCLLGLTSRHCSLPQRHLNVGRSFDLEEKSFR